MSTPERTDDPGEHGYGATKQQPERSERETTDRDREAAEANPSRRGRDDGESDR